LLAISCLTSIIRGARTGSLGLINCGMLLGAALILCRFFEMDTGYLVKGLAFIGAGIVLLVVNLVIVRKRAFLAQTEREGAAQ